MMSYIIKIKTKARSFWRLTLKYKAFFFVNFILCGIARASINTLPLVRLAPYFGRFNRNIICSTLVSTEQRRQAWLIGKSVQLAAKYTPWDSSCLTQAMVAKFWCNRFQIPYVLFIGFAKSAEEVSGYKAHAWVSVGPVAVTGGHGLANYHVVSSYIYSRS